MKKSIFYAFMLTGAMLFTACTSDDDMVDNNIVTTDEWEDAVHDNLTGFTKIEIPAGISKVDIYNWADNSYLGTATVENGHIWVGSKNGCMTVKLYNADANSKSKTRADGDTLSTDRLGGAGNGYTDGGYIKDATVYKSNDDVITIQAAEKSTSKFSYKDYVNVFTERADNRSKTAPSFAKNFEHDVLYKSDGNAFSIYPIYCGGTYEFHLGVFYYDEDGTKHDVDFCNKYAIKMSMGTGYDNETAQGYRITIPEHYVYGFYLWTKENKIKYYSYTAENAGCTSDETKNHAINIVDSLGNNYIAFEDQENGDWDINDLICYITPERPIIEQPNESKKNEELGKIGAIDTPTDIDKIVHGQDTLNNVDVEARYDGKGHDYVRIAIPLKNGEEVQVDLDKMNQYCQADDFRIVTKDDVEVIYCKDGAAEAKQYNNSTVAAQNTSSASGYGKATACAVGTDDDGTYQVKIDLYPKDEDSFNEIVKLIDNKEWDKLFAISKNQARSK